MFHRQKNDTEQPENTGAQNDQQNGQPVASDQQQDSTQSSTKENQTMNTQAQENQSQESQEGQAKGQENQQARVDIPNGNFTRPGIGQATGQPGRPAYPGYPGAANSPAYAAGGDSDRKLMIGKGITLSGEIEECDHLIVEGTIEATLKGANVLDISENGAFHGTAEIEEANIAGRFEGDITVSGRLTVQSTGVIIGSISYKELAVEVGGTIDGSISPIGSANATSRAQGGAKSKKASQDNSAELPFSGGKVAAE